MKYAYGHRYIIPSRDCAFSPHMEAGKCKRGTENLWWEAGFE